MWHLPYQQSKRILDGYDIQFYDRAIIHMDHQNIQPLILKAGDSINDQPKDNGLNSKLIFLYNEVKYAWIIKYGMTKLLPHHMNYSLVESRDDFKALTGKVIAYRFVKLIYNPFIPTDLTTNTQAFTASSQVSSVSKAE